MENKIGIMFAVIIFFLLILPFQLDTMSKSITSSQLMKVGSEIRQIVDASSSDGKDVDVVNKAIGIAKSKSNVTILINDKPQADASDFNMGSNVNIKLSKPSPQILNCTNKYPNKNGKEICAFLMKTQENVKITNRKD